MKKISILLVLLFSVCAQLFAQYNKPYRMTYNSAKKSFLICNRGNGTVTELDSNFKTSQVISGLSDPRDLQYAKFGTNEGLVILDDNKLKVYDASYSNLINFTISLTKEAESLVFDPSTPGIFYISDRSGNQIIEGKVGAAPFYIPSFKVLTNKDIHRPCGLLIDNQNRLLVVEDSLNSGILNINKSSGAVSILRRMGIDSLNSLVQDAEGNFYFSNWSDNYVYRMSSDLKTFQRLAGFSHPSGLLVQADLDLLLICCTNCGKIDFKKLHWFEPESDLSSCSADSVQVQISPLYAGVGTFRSGNRFIVELSDSNGSFANPVNLGFVLSDTNPPQIRGFLPPGEYGSTHRYRLRSTNPSFLSSAKSFFVSPQPRLRAYALDSTSICSGNSINLGAKPEGNVVYRWSPGHYFTDSTQSQVRFTPVSQGHYTFTLHGVDTTSSCSALSKVYIQVSDTISIPTWKRTVRACTGTEIELGIAGTSYNFSWSPAVDLSSDTLSNPIWLARASRRYTVEIKDPVSGCRGRQFIDAVADTLPALELSDSLRTCVGDPLNIGTNLNGLTLISWSPAMNLNDTTLDNPSFKSAQSGTFRYVLRIEDGNFCKASDSVEVLVVRPPILPTISRLRFEPMLRFTLLGGDADSIRLYGSERRSGPYSFLRILAVTDSIQLSIHPDSSSYRWFRYTALNDDNCLSRSDSFEAEVKTGNLVATKWPANCLYPNPVSGSMSLKLPVIQGDILVRCLDMSGRCVKEFRWNHADAFEVLEMDLAEFHSGSYILQVQLEDSVGNYAIHRISILKI